MAKWRRSAGFAECGQASEAANPASNQRNEPIHMKTNKLRIAGAIIALSAALSLPSFAEVVTKSETVSSQPAPVTEQTTTTTTTETPLTHHQAKRLQHERKKELKSDSKAAKERTDHPDRELRKEARDGTLPQ
jgi:hypothetical protein